MANKNNGISLIGVYKTFGTTEACLNYLEAARWPEGVRCLACGSREVSKFITNETIREVIDEHDEVVRTYRVKPRHLYQCRACQFQFTATSGTMFHRTHQPLTIWFRAIALTANAGECPTARQLQRQLGIRRYATAWFLKDRIHRAMENP